MSLLRLRPSAPLAVSFLALFVALGGAGWAAIRIPRNSVGNAQLQNFSVGNAKLRPNSVSANKIVPGSVGAPQVNSGQVQLRVAGPCSIGAIQSISSAGNVTCTPALPNEYGVSAPPTGVGGASTLIASEQLAGGSAGASYLVIGNVNWIVSETAAQPQSVTLACTLQAGTASNSGQIVAELDANHTAQAGALPIILPANIAGSHAGATIACSFSAASSASVPTVNVTATLNAIQTASNS
jgi:hypothetical protein